MTHYLIEFRFHGHAKRCIKDIIFDISKKFNVHGVTRKHPIPHVTLVGPFYTNNEKKLVEEFTKIMKKYTPTKFTLNGFDYFGNWLFGNRTIFIDVKPSEELKVIRFELSNRLGYFCKLNKHDKESKEKFKFHATVAFKDINQKFSKIWTYIKQKEGPKINQTLIRITLLKNSKILLEYDFIQKRLLTRKQAKNKLMLLKTIRLLKKSN